jgi:hypothetical protein
MTKIHDTLPSGFSYANDLQLPEFEATGSVHGAGKIAQVQGVGLAVRLRPPRTLEDVRSRACSAATVEEYVRQYNNGWQHARRVADWPAGTTWAWDDGYLDAAAGRQKWHLTYCTDHDHCGEG